MGNQIFLEFLGSFHYCNSACLRCASPQFCKNLSSSIMVYAIFLGKKGCFWVLAEYVCICRLSEVLTKSAKSLGPQFHKLQIRKTIKDCFHKSQIGKVSHLQKISTLILFKSATWWICDLLILFADRPPRQKVLVIDKYWWPSRVVEENNSFFVGKA